MTLHREEGAYSISEDLWNCLLSFFNNLHWENYLKDMDQQRVPLTFVHGDFHPGNIMWIPGDSDCKVRLFDWEMVSLGLGPQELGQYVISHLDLSKHGVEVHRKLVQAYYEELTTINPEILHSCSFDACMENFVYGGMRKWLWMLPQLSKWNVKFMPYFVNQVDSFRAIHKVRPNDVCYPAV